MKKDAYRAWEPVSNLPQRMFCEGLHDDYEGFRVLLRGGSPTDSVLRIRFDSVLAYRNVDESFRLRTLYAIAGDQPRALWIVDDSTWVQWLMAESLETLAASGLVHYVIFTPNDIIDIIADSAPDVEWLD